MEVDNANMEEGEVDAGLEDGEVSFGSSKIQREERSSCQSTALSSTVLSNDDSFSKRWLAAQKN